MSKKDIQKLNDAMLENVDVSDSVLDMAREQMRAQTPEPVSSPAGKQKRVCFGAARGGAVAISRKTAAVLCACAVCAVLAVVAVIAWLNRGTVNSSGGKSYNIAELAAVEITSVSDYNAQNGTTYLCFEDGQTSTILYSNGETPVLFLETFIYGEVNCTWYVLADYNDYVDILEGFFYSENMTVVESYNVYYSVNDGGQYAFFTAGGSKYFICADSCGENILDILTEILT